MNGPLPDVPLDTVSTPNLIALLAHPLDGVAWCDTLMAIWRLPEVGR